MSVKTEQGLMQHAGQQFGQGIPPSHSQYSPPEPTVSSSNSITSSLRLWRKKDSGDKKSTIEAPPTSAGSETHVARVAPQTHYQSFSSHDVCRYTNSFPKDFSPLYKQPTPPVPVKYSEIVEPSPLQKIDQLSQAAQKQKDKDCIEMANHSPLTMKPYLDHYGLKQHYPPPDASLKQQYTETLNRSYIDGLKQPYAEPPLKFQYSENMKQSYQEPLKHPFTEQLKEPYHDPNIPSQYIPKEAQLHSIHKESQLYPYVPKEAHLQQYISKYSIPYSRPYTVDQNNYLAHLNKIHPRMAQSIISDPHLREPAQVPVYHGLDHGRPYPPVQRMYNHQAPPPLASNHPYSTHVNRNLPQHPYSYQQSYNMNVKQNADPYRVPYHQPSMSKYMTPPEPPLRNCSPRRPFNDNAPMQMNYSPVTSKLPSPMYPPCSQLEYAQHYQHRREQLPDFYSPVGGYKSPFINQSPLATEMTGDGGNTKSNALKQFLESWVDEEMSGLPDVVVSNNLEEKFSVKPPHKRDEANEPPLYILDTTEISSENLPQYMHLQQFEKLPENIKGYYHINKDALGGERAVVHNGYVPNDKSSTTQEYNLKSQIPQGNETRFVSEQVKAIGIQNGNEFDDIPANRNRSHDSNEKVIQLHITDSGQVSHETQSVRSIGDFETMTNSTVEKVIQVHIREPQPVQQNVVLVKPQSNNNERISGTSAENYSLRQEIDEDNPSSSTSNSACMYSNNSDAHQNNQRFRSNVNVLQHIVLSPSASQSQQEAECTSQESSIEPTADPKNMSHVLEEQSQVIEDSPIIETKSDDQSQQLNIEKAGNIETTETTIKEETDEIEIKTETTKTFPEDTNSKTTNDLSKEANSEDHSTSNSQKNQVHSVIVSTYQDSVSKETSTEFEESVKKEEYENSGVTSEKSTTESVDNPRKEIMTSTCVKVEETESIPTNVNQENEIKAEEQEQAAQLTETNCLSKEISSGQSPDDETIIKELSEANSEEHTSKEDQNEITSKTKTSAEKFTDSVKEENETNVEQNHELEESLPTRSPQPEDNFLQNIEKNSTDNLEEMESAEILNQIEQWIENRNETENSQILDDDNQNTKETNTLENPPEKEKTNTNCEISSKNDDNKIAESEIPLESEQTFDNDNPEQTMSCSDEVMTESEYRRAYKIEENNVLLQIGDDLIEINVSEKNGKKLINIKSLTDAIITNDSVDDKNDAKETELCVTDIEEEIIKEINQRKTVNYSEELLCCIEENGNVIGDKEDGCQNEDINDGKELTKETYLMESTLPQEEVETNLTDDQNTNASLIFFSEVNASDSYLEISAGDNSVELKEKEEVTSSECNSHVNVKDLEQISDIHHDSIEEKVNNNELDAISKENVEIINNSDKIIENLEEPGISVSNNPEEKLNMTTESRFSSKAKDYEEGTNLTSRFCITSKITETKTDDTSPVPNDHTQNSLKIVFKKCKVENKEGKDKEAAGNILKSKGEKKVYEEKAYRKTKEKGTDDKHVQKYDNEKHVHPKERKGQLMPSKSSYLKQHSVRKKLTEESKSHEKSSEDKQKKLKGKDDKKILSDEKKDVNKKHIHSHQKREKSPVKSDKTSLGLASSKHLSNEPPPILSPDMDSPNISKTSSANLEKSPESYTKLPKKSPLIKPPRRSFNKQLSEDLLPNQVSKKKEEINFELIHNEIVIDHEFKFCSKQLSVESPKDDSNKTVQEHRITSSTEKHDEDDSGAANKRRLSLEEYNRRKRMKITKEIPKDADSATVVPIETCSNLTDNLLLNISNNKKQNDEKLANDISPAISKPEIINRLSSAILVQLKDIPIPVSSTESEKTVEKVPESPSSPNKFANPWATIQQYHYESRWANQFRSKTLEPVNTQMVKEYETLMQRFLKQDQLTVDELKKVKQIIRYKRWLQQQKSKEETLPKSSDPEALVAGSIQRTVETIQPSENSLDINANENLHLKDCDYTKSKDIDNQKTCKVFERPEIQSRPVELNDIRDKRRNRKRFRNLYTEDESDFDGIECVKSDAKKANVETVKTNDYSVRQSDSQRAIKLVFKRSISNSNLQPIVWLERSDSLDQLAKNYS